MLKGKISNLIIDSQGKKINSDPYQPGSSFGELELLMFKDFINAKICLTECHLITLNKTYFLNIFKEYEF